MNAEEQKSIEEQKKLEEENKAGERAYLREEIKQILGFTYEHSSKTIMMIWGIWGSISVVYGATNYLNASKLLSSLFCMTIFFISVVILHFSIRKIRSNVESLFKIAAYIKVFHEGKNGLYWETAQYDTDIKACEDKENIKLFNENNSETMYKVFMMFSIIGIIISPIIFFGLSEFQAMLSKAYELEKVIEIILFSNTYLLYICVSCYLLYKSYAPIGNFNERKKKHIKRFENRFKEIKSP